MTTIQNSFNDACKAGDLKTVKSLAKGHQADIHADDEWALRCVAENGHLDIVKYLAEEQHADIHINNEYALKWAAESEHFDTVKYLVEEQHADIHIDDEYVLRFAAWNEHLEIALYFVDQGAEYDSLQEHEETLPIYNKIIEHVQEKEKQAEQSKQQQLYTKNIGVLKNTPSHKTVRRRPKGC